MDKYAIIDIGGKQLRVEPGRFYDARHFASLRKAPRSNTKISITRVLLLRHGSSISIGYPWLNNAIVRGRILHDCFRNKLLIQKIYSKKKKRRIFGYRENMIRFVVDSIYVDGKNLNAC
uniref:Large ribosomal subunit protein bL21c n=1 Tax=Saccoloma inaequale TaxID=262953 RepID=A0A5B9RFT0_9MONI|nr:ribosomal protein L21 [Saccoloma inaequale]QEG57839.1 ribosomal protein L21 [Saccoloma inaequale]